MFRSNPSRRHLLASLSWVALIILVPLLLYFFYVAGQTHKVRERNLRLLDGAARSVEEVVANARHTVRNLARDFPTACRFGERQPFLELVEPGTCQGLQTLANSDTTMTDLRLGPGPRLLIYAWKDGSVPPPGPVECTFSDGLEDRDWNCFKVALDLEKVLAETPLEEAFEALLVADETGRIVQQRSAEDLGGGLRVHDLDQLALEEGGEVEESLSYGTLQRASRVASLRLGDERYQLFTQPLRLDGYVGAREAEGEAWLLGGVVLGDRALSQALTVAPQLVFALVLLLILGLLTWPFIKLAVMARQERFRFTDAYFLAFSTFALLLVSTILLLDLDSYQRLRKESAASLERLALKLEENLLAELEDLRGQLRDFDRRFCEDCPGRAEGLKTGETWQATALLSPREGVGFGCAEEPGAALPHVYFSSVFWMDGEGLQRIKGTVRHENTPAVVLAGREYFRRVRDRRLWLSKKNGERFFVESYRSITTGERHSALSMESCLRSQDGEGEGKGVVAAAISMQPLALTEPLLPPGFGFAVVDAEGHALYHSDPRRALSENLRAEVSDPRRFESILFSRTAQHFYTHYRTRPHLMYVRPLEELPWTVVTFRDQELLRTVNLEAVTQALLLAGVYFLVCYLLPSLVLARMRGWSTGWLWPDTAKQPLYRRLSWQLAVVFLLTLAVLPRLSAAQRLTASFLVPVVTVLAVGLSFLFFYRRKGSDAAVSATAPVRPRSWRPREVLGWWWNGGLLFWHVASVVLLWFLVAVLPAIGFFRVAWGDQMRLFARYEALRLLEGYDARACRLEEESRKIPLEDRQKFLAERRALEADVYLPDFEGGKIEERREVAATTPPPSPGWLDRTLRSGWTVQHKPFYNETSVFLRYLSSEAAGDGSWRWREDEAAGEMGMELPASACAGALRFTTPARAWRPVPGPFVLVGGLSLTCLLALWVRFSATRLFFLRIARQVDPLDVSVLVDRPYLANVIALVASPFDRRDIFCSPHYVPVDLATAEPGRMVPAGEEGKPVVCDHFEDGLSDPAARRRKLELLEELVYRHEGGVVILSSLDPFESFEWLQAHPPAPTQADEEGEERAEEGAPAPAAAPAGKLALQEDEARRWGRLLSAFVLIPVGLARYRPLSDRTTATSEGDARSASEPGTAWLKLEFDKNPELERLVLARVRGGWPSSHREALERILEALEGFYLALWTACSEEEKLVLVQLAQERFVNPKQIRTVRRLLQRGLIVRDPVLRPMNESFRLFVERVHEPLEVSSWEESVGRLGWKQLRWPFLAILAVTGTFLFATQKELFDASIALISALALGVPGLLRLVAGLNRGRSRLGE